jgi:anti-anti-sigma regulatory factor
MIDVVAGGWALEVERGPGWLFVRLNSAPEGWWQAPPLAECIWSLLEQHFVYRVVLECEQLPRLTSSLVAQLQLLWRRIDGRGGVMRLCGLSTANQELLDRCGLAQRFPHYQAREDAVLANRPRALRPSQPR